MKITRKILNWYARLSPKHGVSLPPYNHVVQVGDPTLRKVSEPVPIENIKTKEIQTLILKLRFVMNKYKSVGMSAPQIGVNMRIFVMQLNPLQLANVPQAIVKSRGMEVIPFTVFVNPTLKVLNYNKVILSEGCESVQGYTADVPRYKEIQISGYNEDGNPTSNTYRDWAARVAQHEIEHLDGKLYVDIMDRKTMSCVCWEEVNLSKGKLAIPFSPE
ncbi:peptide deformylase, mitochondrial [Bombyx mori]|uniref:Peptide deformylase n=1 Tax=Bombyx mori TaxID=7091 RepID=A0A8R1WNA6_BOMMO|nr:peptide deformylase, mitochondrial [Bombyx mori]